MTSLCLVDYARLPRTLLIALLVTLVGFATQPIQPAYAVTIIVVNETTDELNADGDCSLREAIETANSGVQIDNCTDPTIGGPPYTITLPAGTYTLTTGVELLTTADMIINGAGAGTTIIQAATTPGVAAQRVLHNDGGNVTIRGVTIRHGRCAGFCLGGLASEGGGILNDAGALTLDACTVSDNQAWFNAGGIFNRTTLNIQNGSVIGGVGAGNQAGTHGGGIINLLGTVTVDGSTISGNQAGTDGGGIITTAGIVTIDASTVSANVANRNGGGIFHASGTMIIQNGSVIGGAGTGNEAIQEGGGLYNSNGPVTIDDSTVSDNRAGANGGGIHNINSGTITAIRNSVIANNATTSNGGYGGGIFNRGTITIIENSRITGNVVNNSGTGSGYGGGILNISSGRIGTITRVTFDGNRAQGIGGAIANYGAGLATIDEISHSTFSGNIAHSGAGGSIYSNWEITTLNYNAFVGNQAASGGSGIENLGQPFTNFTDNYFDSIGTNCNGTTAGARNFDDDGTCGTDIGVAPGMHYNGTLTDNGCVTPLADGSCVPTYALIPGSALENPTGGANCGATDERDFARDTVCDIGPFELLPPDINVQRLAGTSIADGGTDNVGTQAVGAQTLTYTIENVGLGELVIPAGGVTASNLTNVSGFSANTVLPLNIPAGNSATLQISYTVDAVGAFSFDLDIASNDADENPYNIHVQGTGTINLVTSTACNGNDLIVNITAGDANFDVSANDPASVTQTQNNVPTGSYTLTSSGGGGTWTNIIVSELSPDNETVNVADRQCPPPVVSGAGGGGGAASGCKVVIDVEADREAVAPGDRVMWTVLIRNAGSTECQGVQTYGTMPGEFSITDISPSRGSLIWDGGQYYRVDLGTLVVGEQVTVILDSLLQGGAAVALPEGAAGQSAGQQICLTGYITDPVNDTDCVTLFPDSLPPTGGEPVNESLRWVWLAAAGLLIAGLGGTFFGGRKPDTRNQSQEGETLCILPSN